MMQAVPILDSTVAPAHLPVMPQNFRDAEFWNPQHPQSLDQSLECFCQLQAEQLSSQTSAIWVQIVYHDPRAQQHRQVVYSADARISSAASAYLRSEAWLQEFPLVSSLTEVELPLGRGYVCPIGYKSGKPEYILVLADDLLSSPLKDMLLRSVLPIKQFLELYSSYLHQKSENQLLEHILHRVGHQLRNPLSLVELYAENLRLESTTHHTQEQAIVIRETVQSLLADLSDLIQCSKSSHLKLGLCDLRSLIAESIQPLQPWIEQQQLTIHYPASSLPIWIDRLQMKQVFANLLSNAVHFSPFGGTICLDWQAFQSEVLIQISDQGPGLSPEDLQKLFTPFYSRRPGGTGLGLTIAKKIVLDHQGNLWAQTLPEGGTRFAFILPRTLLST